jgi:hypothetical protein
VLGVTELIALGKKQQLIYSSPGVVHTSCPGFARANETMSSMAFTLKVPAAADTRVLTPSSATPVKSLRRTYASNS